MIKHSAGARTQLFELAARFERIRDLLLTDRYEARLKHPLSYWVLPADRRLPRALFHRPLGDLLRTSFQSLAATPGIGHKKIHSLLQLLDRALCGEEFANEPIDVVSGAGGMTGGDASPIALHGDPANISEVTWAKWRAVVVEHGLGDQPLGRFAVNLHELPRVIWNAPLSNYATLTLEQIRRLKTHGEKRVRAVVAIFGRLYSHLVAGRGLADVTPQGVEGVERWLADALTSSELPSEADLRLRFLLPLVEQIRLDAGEATADLVLGRLGWEGQKLSVRRAAIKLRLTRARIYQLLEDAETVVAVRWPKGLARMRALIDRASALPVDSAQRRVLTLAAETFFASEFRPQIVPPPAFLRRFETPAPVVAWPTATPSFVLG